MPQTLLLRLPLLRTDDAEWVTLDDAGQPAAGRQRGPLELAAAVGRSARVVIVVPATHVLLAEPELPPGNGLKLARAAPFALEEQLTEDIDQLVFALGKRRPNGGTPVAVVSRSVLEGWMSDLKTAGIAPVAMYADMSLVPHNPGQTLLWFERGRLSVRRPGMLPFAVELTPVTEALIVAGIIADPLRTHGLVSTLEAAPTPESALFYVTREDWGKVQTEIESLIDEFASLKVQILPDGPLPWLARELRTTDAVNLLQGEFAQRRDSGARWHRWRTAAALAIGLLVLHVGAQAYQLHRAKQESAALDTEISQVFAAAMPTETPQNPRRQMQARLDRIRHSGAGPQRFLHTLQTLSGAIAAAPKTSIDSMSYHEESLDLKVTAPSLAALSQLSQTVGREGLIAEIQSSTPSGQGVEAHLQVRTQGSKAHR